MCLMPKNDGGYRDYSDVDIDRIWTIRILQGMGYTLTEIVNMTNDETLSTQIENVSKKVNY